MSGASISSQGRTATASRLRGWDIAQLILNIATALAMAALIWMSLVYAKPAVNLAGKKPWEVKHLLDTMELWKFGDNKAYTSLNLLSAILDFPTPKDDMDGSQVGRVYWEEKDLDRISFYCEKDVLATVQLFLRYQRMDILRDEQISHVRDDGRAA